MKNFMRMFTEDEIYFIECEFSGCQKIIPDHYIEFRQHMEKATPYINKYVFDEYIQIWENIKAKLML